LTISLVSAKLRMCPSKTQYRLKFITPEDDPEKGVAFLISKDRRITAKEGFDGLRENTERHFQSKFDYWLTGKPYPQGYHGWNQNQWQGKYTKCFVFTHDEEKVAQRFYGFLSNPKPSDRRYCICVLVRYARKVRHEIDETDLKIVEEIRISPEVQKTIDEYFKEKP